jgi:magnesium-transporting ATPase (P-type)
VTTARHALALAEAQTICVTSITFTQIFYLLNCRSLRDSLFSQGVFSNPAIFIGIGILLLLQSFSSTCRRYRHFLLRQRSTPGPGCMPWQQVQSCCR